MTDLRVPACQDRENVYTTAEVEEALHQLDGTEGPFDGDDPLADNVGRAQRACDAVVAYASRDSVIDGESFFLAVSDMLNDLRHLLDFTRDLESDSYPKTFEELAARDIHYQEEI